MTVAMQYTVVYLYPMPNWSAGKYKMNNNGIAKSEMEALIERVRRGDLTASEANVEQVRMSRVYLVAGRIPSGVRSALNEAVKKGKLCHIKKDGHKPEAYYHPEFDYMVAGKRNAVARQVLAAVAKVTAPSYGDHT